MATHYTKDMLTGRITEVTQATAYVPNPERQARVDADAARVKRHARTAAFAAGITRVEYEASNRMRAAWEARAVADLTASGVDLHRSVVLAYGAI